MAATHRAARTETIGNALARVSEIGQSLGILLDRLDSRPDPDAEIQEANLMELLLALAATERVQRILIDLHREL